MGRFINEDPAMDPNNPNLYSYCGNNPTGRIDPDGQWWLGALIGAVTAALEGGNRHDILRAALIGLVSGYVGSTISGAVGTLGSGFWGTIATGAVVGGLTGFTMGVLTGGDPLKSFTTGFISGGISSVGTYLNKFIPKQLVSLGNDKYLVMSNPIYSLLADVAEVKLDTSLFGGSEDATMSVLKKYFSRYTVTFLEPEVLVKVDCVEATGKDTILLINAKIADKFKAFVQECKDKQIPFKVSDFFRDSSKQNHFYELKKMGDTEDLVNNHSVKKGVNRPGKSYHEVGLAFDLEVQDLSKEQCNQVVEIGQRYGFYRNYMPSEPWHFSYTGGFSSQTQVAKSLGYDSWESMYKQCQAAYKKMGYPTYKCPYGNTTGL